MQWGFDETNPTLYFQAKQLFQKISFELFRLLYSILFVQSTSG